MLYFKKSQPAPDCLEQEKSKKNGDYKCGDVLDRLKVNFKKMHVTHRTRNSIGRKSSNICIRHRASHHLSDGLSVVIQNWWKNLKSI